MTDYDDLTDAHKATMCEPYKRMFDALDQLPTDEYLALGSLLSKKMIEGPPATSRFLTVMAIELMEPVVELHWRIRRQFDEIVDGYNQ
ncbi:MAG: hypothetical protein IH818_10180 [Acidobacteria bacterium]|nr:hypothetical protein [Acidobacteriota bacterium]